jgi:hypothetical protein
MYTNLGPVIVKLKILTTDIREFDRNLYSLLLWYPCLSPFACKVEIATFFFSAKVGFVYIARYARKPRKSSFYSPNSNPTTGRPLLTV